MQITKELIEKYWPLTNVEVGEYIEHLEEVKDNVAIITSDEGKFTFKIASPWITKDALEIDLELFDFLHEQNFKHITQLLETKEGKKYIQIDIALVYILAFVEGNHPEPTQENYKKLGAITAELHNIKNCPYITEYRANYIIEHNLIEIAEKLLFENDYLALVKQQPNYDLFPMTMIHSDLGPGNAIQRPDGEIILIDWDDAGVGTTILDLGYPLIHQFVTEDLEFKEENAKAFYDAYFSERSISELEKKHIFDAAMFYALFYIVYGNTEKRWKRIQWAMENRKKLEAVYL